MFQNKYFNTEGALVYETNVREVDLKGKCSEVVIVFFRVINLKSSNSRLRYKSVIGIQRLGIIVFFRIAISIDP